MGCLHVLVAKMHPVFAWPVSYTIIMPHSIKTLQWVTHNNNSWRESFFRHNESMALIFKCFLAFSLLYLRKFCLGSFCVCYFSGYWTSKHETSWLVSEKKHCDMWTLAQLVPRCEESNIKQLLSTVQLESKKQNFCAMKCNRHLVVIVYCVLLLRWWRKMF